MSEFEFNVGDELADGTCHSSRALCTSEKQITKIKKVEKCSLENPLQFGNILCYCIWILMPKLDFQPTEF